MDELKSWIEGLFRNLSRRISNLETIVNNADLTEIPTTSTPAPTNAQYVTLALNGTLTDERVLTAGANIGLTDGGAGSTITVAVTGLDSGDISDFTEAAQDAVGGALTDTNSVDLTYNDGSNQITADVRIQDTNSIDLGIDASGLKGDVKIQDTTSVDLAINAGGLKATVLPAGVDHASLNNLNSASYTHLTATNHTDLTDGGDTTLHYHASDRAYSDERWIDISRDGFIDNTQTSISFNDGTYVFTLTDAGAGWKYMRNGMVYSVTGNKTVTLPGTPPATGFYYIYIDANDGTLTQSTSAWTLLDQKVEVATISWNNGLTPKYQLADERHTCLIDSRMHYYLHNTLGSRYINGGVLSGYSVAPVTPGDTDNTFAISQVTIADEDLIETLSALADPNGTATDYVVFFRTSLTAWSWEASAMPYRYTAAGYIQYDNVGTMTQGGTAKYYNSYLIFSNFQGAARFVIIPGRGEFSSLATAQAESPTGFDFTGYPSNEGVIAYQLTWDTSAAYGTKGKARLAVAPKRINAGISSPAISGTGIDHNTLSGLQGGLSPSEFYHLTAAQVAALHPAVTLAADAANILDLSTQEIGLDAQSANTVLAGPTTGADTDPDFRALVADDIPSLTAAKISDFDTEVSNNTDVAANTAARHAAVTLSVGAGNILGLTGQEISFDNQNANYFLAGPDAGISGPVGYRNIVGDDLPGASESAWGAVKIATQAETDAGTIDDEVITPLKLKSVPIDHLRVSKLVASDGSPDPALSADAAGDLLTAGKLSLPAGKDVYTLGDTFGLSQVLINLQQYINIGPTQIAAVNWAAYDANWATPSSISTSLIPGYCTIYHNAAKKHFGYLSSYYPNISAVVEPARLSSITTGIRMDDNGTTNFIELVVVTAASGGAVSYKMRWNGSETVLFGGGSFTPQRVALAMGRSGDTVYCFVGFGMYFSSYVGVHTMVAGWTPARCGIYHEQASAGGDSQSASIFRGLSVA